jgi:Ca2+-binding EF-hand superfamily protein
MEMLLNLAREPALRRAVMITIGVGARTKTYRDARRQFLDLDLTGSGTIAQESFMELSKEYCRDDAEATELFKKLDIHDHKELQYSEFLAAYMNLELVEDEDAILRAFRVFDADRDGSISVTDLEKVFANMDGRRMLEEVGCIEPGGMDLSKFRLMVLTPSAPGSPSSAKANKRVHLVDNDLGGAGESPKKSEKVQRTPSLIHPEMARSISVIRPPCKIVELPSKALREAKTSEASTSATGISDAATPSSAGQVMHI